MDISQVFEAKTCLPTQIGILSQCGDVKHSSTMGKNQYHLLTGASSLSTHLSLYKLKVSPIRQSVRILVLGRSKLNFGILKITIMQVSHVSSNNFCPIRIL